MAAYYNEIDPFSAAWLRSLIAKNLIAPGDVDERSIEDVCPDDLKSYQQCHFFAGIGVWSHALRSAGWPDHRPVWTGSCPCQPFSTAGKGEGFADERHLWPAFFHLISECNPSIVFGEQVASKDGLGWLDLVRADVEAEGYAFGASDLCAAGVGAPHIRQRLYWVANSDSPRLEGQKEQPQRKDLPQQSPWPGCVAHRVANSDSNRCFKGGEASKALGQGHPLDANGGVLDGRPADGYWRDADWLLCRDGKWRPVESGTFPLADGVAGRVGRLWGYGNAIVAPVAQTFIEAFMSVLHDDGLPALRG